MIDLRLQADIQTAEECRLIAYLDTMGYWTIGWGHKLPLGRDWTGTTWTQAQADAQLMTDITAAAQDCLSLQEWPFLDTPCRQNAVIELVFNMGRMTWQTFFRTRQAIKAHDWQTAHDQLLASKWEVQVHATRADRIANYLLTGQYPT
jgi:GH24 family phage-related lysozyme (muramidase)